MIELLAGSHRDQLSFPYTLGKIAKYLQIPKIKGYEEHAESCNEIFLKIPHRHQILDQLKNKNMNMNTADNINDINPEKLLNKYHQRGDWYLDGNFKVPQEEGQIFDENYSDI